MKVCVLTMVWKRPEVFNVFADSISTLKKHFTQIQIDVIAVGSEGRKSKDMVEGYGFRYHEHKNFPLSAKAQHRLEKAKLTDSDAFLFLGSDDIISPAYFSYITQKLAIGHDLIASTDIYYTSNGELFYSCGYPKGNPRYGEPIAPGKLVSRRLLERCNWKLWEEQRKRGIDRMATNKLIDNSQNKHLFSCREIGAMLIDVKSKTNLYRVDSDLSAKSVTRNLIHLLPNDIARQIQSF